MSWRVPVFKRSTSLDRKFVQTFVAKAVELAFVKPAHEPDAWKRPQITDTRRSRIVCKCGPTTSKIGGRRPGLETDPLPSAPLAGRTQSLRPKASTKAIRADAAFDF